MDFDIYMVYLLKILGFGLYYGIKYDIYYTHIFGKRDMTGTPIYSFTLCETLCTSLSATSLNLRMFASKILF